MEKNEEGKKKKKNDVEKIDCENNKKKTIDISFQVAHQIASTSLCCLFV